MLNASSVEARSLWAGVNEVPRSSATFCSTISVAQRDGWYETGRRAPLSQPGEQDHQQPWVEFSQMVLRSRGVRSDPFDRKTNWKGKKIRRQMPVFKKGAGTRRALHLIKLRLHTAMVFWYSVGDFYLTLDRVFILRCLPRKETFLCSFWVPGLISVLMIAPFGWLKKRIDSWWLCLLSSPVSLH